jgi:hypothetical protein
LAGGRVSFSVLGSAEETFARSVVRPGEFWPFGRNSAL